MPQEQFSGVVVLSEKKYKELEEKGKIENTKLYTNSQFINTPTKVSQLENDEQYLKEGDIKIVNSLNSSSHTSALSALQGKKLNERLQIVEGEVSGTTKSFTVENLAELGNLFYIDIENVSNAINVNTSEIMYRDNMYSLNNGDTFLIIDTEVPDYWFSKDNLCLYKMETNITHEFDGIEIDSTLSLESENPVQNKVISEALNSKAQNELATTEKNGLMAFQDKKKLNVIGQYINCDIIDQITEDGEKVEIASLKLETGLWILSGNISYEFNDAGYRKLSLVNSSLKINCCNTGTTDLNCFEIIYLNEENLVKIHAQQNSGSNLAVNGKISAIRIA